MEAHEILNGPLLVISSEKKVGLSLRAVGEEASRADVEAYKQPVSSSTTTLGEIMNWKRASNDQD